MSGPGAPILVFSCDGAYAMPLATALRSAAESNPDLWPLEVHVLCHAFPQPKRARVAGSLPEGSVVLRWVEVDLSAFGALDTLAHVSSITYARLRIPDVFPEEVERVLYLDGDLLVLGSLRPLWETDLGGCVVGAVHDGLAPKLAAGEPNLPPVPAVKDYFNSGVLLIDLPRWREEEISRRALEWLAAHPRPPFMDQDALNVACDGRWRALDPRWNHQEHYEARDISRVAPEERPGILHFVTRRKPWDFRRPGPNARFYDAIRSRTRFARGPLEHLRDAARQRVTTAGQTVRAWRHRHGLGSPQSER